MILETKELEQKLKTRIHNVMPDLTLSQLWFTDENHIIPEGLTIYTKDNKYHYVSTERGQIRAHEQYDNEDDVLWIILHNYLWVIAAKYAAQNTKPGIEYRRVYFSKQIELFSLFSEEFGKRRAAEIEEILRVTPYHDQDATDGSDCEN